MSVEHSYTCDLCKVRFDSGSQVYGFPLPPPGQEPKPLAESRSHICEYCVEQVNRLNDVVELTDGIPRSAVRDVVNELYIMGGRPVLGVDGIAKNDFIAAPVRNAFREAALKVQTLLEPHGVTTPVSEITQGGKNPLGKHSTNGAAAASPTV